MLLANVLLALTVVLIACHLLGLAFRQLGQPAVMGEIIAGILLGPTLLGRVAPEVARQLFSSNVMPVLAMLAQLGVIFYMFLLGLEIDFAVIRSRARSSLFIAAFSFIVTFAGGAILGFLLRERLAAEHTPSLIFVLFAGVAIATTALPVLARILSENGLAGTPLGLLAIASAALHDLMVWCLLAAVIGFASAHLDLALEVVLKTLAFVAIMLIVVRPLLNRWLEKTTAPATAIFYLLAMLVCALTTEWIGIHGLFGAFLLGTILPHRHPTSESISHHWRGLIAIFLLPIFFAMSGLRTEIGLIDGWEDWLICALIVAVASVGAIGSAYLAARWTGSSRSEAASLAILLNTRGLMALIVLNIGLERHIITPRFFTMMVLMALITTLATTPILRMLGKFQEPQTVSPRLTNG